MWIALILLSCRQAEVVDACLDDPELCPACAEDTECVFQGNNCYAQVYCAHQQSGMTFTLLGCLERAEYRWPDDSECACIQEICQSAP